MVKFFRDVLNGPLYIIVVLLSVILIMAIIGFMLERKQKEKYEKSKVAFVDNGDVPNVAEQVTPEVPVKEEAIPVIEESTEVKTNE